MDGRDHGMISKRASGTSQKLAALVLMAGTCPRWQQILPPSWILAQRKHLRELGLYPRLRFKLYESQGFQKVILFLDRWLLESQLVYMILRKRFFAEQVQMEIERGTRQVVILGAGIDPAGTQLATQYPQVQIWEIDRCEPVSSPLNHQAPKNLHRLTVDLTNRRWHETLVKDPTWQVNAPSVFIAEGLFMYLTEEAVKDVLRSLQQLSPTQGSLFFGYLRSTSTGRPHYGKYSMLVRLGLRCVGEPLRWSVNPDQLQTFLKNAGLKSTLGPDETDLHHRYLEASGTTGCFPPPSIEFMSDARWGQSCHEEIA